MSKKNVKGINSKISNQRKKIRELMQKKIPVLMYHSILDNKDISIALKNKACVTVQKFQKDMVALKRAGYTSIFLKDYEELKNSNTLPKKPIIITFDDGYLNNFLYAYPILKNLQMKATIFVIGNAITNANGAEIQVEKYINRKDEEILEFDSDLLEYDFPFLTTNEKFNWAQTKEMVNSGYINIQHHTWDLHKPYYSATQAKGVDYLRQPRKIGFKVSYNFRFSGSNQTRLFLPRDLFKANRNLTPNEIASLNAINGSPITVVRSKFWNSEIIKLKTWGSLVIPNNGVQPYLKVRNRDNSEYTGTLQSWQCVYFDNILDEETVYTTITNPDGTVTETPTTESFYDPRGTTTFGTPQDKAETEEAHKLRINNDFDLLKDKMYQELGYYPTAFAYPNGLNIEPGSRKNRSGPSYLPAENEYSNRGIKYMVLASSADEGIWDTEKAIMHEDKDKRFLRISRINVDEFVGGSNLVKKLEDLLIPFIK